MFLCEIMLFCILFVINLGVLGFGLKSFIEVGNFELYWECVLFLLYNFLFNLVEFLYRIFLFFVMRFFFVFLNDWVMSVLKGLK